MAQVQIIPGTIVAHYHCPDCKTDRPPYGFNMNGADLGPAGGVQYFTIFCAADLPGELTAEDNEQIVVDLEKRDPNYTILDLEYEAAKRRKALPARLCGCILAVQVMHYSGPGAPRGGRADA